MRSIWEGRPTPVYDRSDPARTAPTVINHLLDQLRIGENCRLTPHPDGYDVRIRDIAPGDGWCRAVSAPECAWPDGAHLCVVVQWFPDQKFPQTWGARFETVMAALRSGDLAVEHTGRGAVPMQYQQADMLVYQMELDKAPPQRPDDAWAYVPAPRTYLWPEHSPLEECRQALRAVGIGSGDGDHLYQVSVWNVTSALWPPRAESCSLLRWRPEPDRSAQATGAAFGRLLALVVKAGYRTRTPPHGSRPVGGEYSALVYRDAPADGTAPAVP